MIDDIVYETVPFILEYVTPITGTIAGYSLNGGDYDFNSIIITGGTSGVSESSYVFIS